MVWIPERLNGQNVIQWINKKATFTKLCHVEIIILSEKEVNIWLFGSRCGRFLHCFQFFQTVDSTESVETSPKSSWGEIMVLTILKDQIINIWVNTYALGKLMDSEQLWMISLKEKMHVFNIFSRKANLNDSFNTALPGLYL